MSNLDFSSMRLKKLEEYILSIGEKKFRAKQIYEWLNQKLVNNFDEMTNLSKDLREKLISDGFISEIKIIEKLLSNQDKTTKYLFKINGDNIIESVLMDYSFGKSVCVSTQAGCRMNCSFCASAINGLERNLSAGEILGQVYNIQKDVNERISNIVLMGSGEPLDNYENVLDFIYMITDKNGLNIGERHITLSTCGLIDKIEKLSNLDLKITLAISLHAPNDEIRKGIMPIAKAYSINNLIKACNNYVKKTKRRVTYEYALIKDVNDKNDHARELSERLKNSLCHVNLIPINDVKEKAYIKSNEKRIQEFYNILNNNGINTTIRRELGSDINASCGQLRNQKMK